MFVAVPSHQLLKGWRKRRKPQTRQNDRIFSLARNVVSRRRPLINLYINTPDILVWVLSIDTLYKDKVESFKTSYIALQL